MRIVFFWFEFQLTGHFISLYHMLSLSLSLNHTHTHTHMHIHTCMYAHTHTHTCTCACLHTSACTVTASVILFLFFSILEWQKFGLSLFHFGPCLRSQYISVIELKHDSKTVAVGTYCQ